MAATSDPRINHPVIAELRELRGKYCDAEWNLFSAMRRIETKEKHRWQNEFPTFERLLEFGHLVDIARYRDWIKAAEEYGEDLVREAGIDMAALLARKNIQRDVAMEALSHAAISRKTNGFSISKRQVNAVLSRLDPKRKHSGLVEKESREQTAHAQLIQAKRRILSLENENARLKEEVGLLRERLMKMGVSKTSLKRPSRKPMRKRVKRKGSDKAPGND